jgi:hypothetical protein
MWVKIDDRAVRHVYMCANCEITTNHTPTECTFLTTLYCQRCKRYKEYDHTEIDLDTYNYTYPVGGK